MSPGCPFRDDTLSPHRPFRATTTLSCCPFHPARDPGLLLPPFLRGTSATSSPTAATAAFPISTTALGLLDTWHRPVFRPRAECFPSGRSSLGEVFPGEVSLRDTFLGEVLLGETFLEEPFLLPRPKADAGQLGWHHTSLEFLPGCPSPRAGAERMC